MFDDKIQLRFTGNTNHIGAEELYLAREMGLAEFFATRRMM